MRRHTSRWLLTATLCTWGGLAQADDTAALLDRLAAPIDAEPPPRAAVPRAAPVTAPLTAPVTAPAAAKPPPEVAASTQVTPRIETKKSLAESLRPREGASSTSPGGTLGFVMVGAVLFLLAGVTVWLKRRGVGATAARPKVDVELISATRLGGGKFQVGVVRVAGRTLVVGMADHGMSLLCELDEMDLRTEAAHDEPKAAATSSFMQRLEQLRSGLEQRRGATGLRRPQEARESMDAPVDEVMRADERRALRERLEALRARAA